MKPTSVNEDTRRAAPFRNKSSVFAPDTLPWLISFSLGIARAVCQEIYEERR